MTGEGVEAKENTAARVVGARMRIAAIIDTTTVSGPGRQLAALAVELGGLGVDFLVILFHRLERPEPAFARYLRVRGVKCEVIPERHRWDPSVLRLLRQTLVAYGPNIVQTHGYKATSLAAAMRREGAAWQWVGFFHGDTSETLMVRWYHRIDRFLLRFADAVVVMAGSQRALLSRRCRDVRVIYNAMLPAVEAADDADSPRGSLFADVDHPVLGVVGRLSPEKGVDLFLRACEILSNRRFAFTALIVGDGPERERLERLTSALRLGRRVRFVGTVGDPGPIYRGLDLLVIPSRSEGLPNVLLEALARDVRVVATRVGAIADVVRSEDAGVVVPPLSPQALADGIMQAWSRDTESERRSVPRAVKDRFALSARVAAHLALYESLRATAA